ncbi:hypothetical protein GCM10010315_41210 [Streptomyces luteosporeus]|uniref:Secreted protein n=1 Tax=Streptomyces luteosporeus TaxID=173856 RepID=A0ABP6GB53_9ACTN
MELPPEKYSMRTETLICLGMVASAVSESVKATSAPVAAPNFASTLQCELDVRADALGDLRSGQGRDLPIPGAVADVGEAVAVPGAIVAALLRGELALLLGGGDSAVQHALGGRALLLASAGVEDQVLQIFFIARLPGACFSLVMRVRGGWAVAVVIVRPSNAATGADRPVTRRDVGRTPG